MPSREHFLLRQAYGGTSRPDKCLVVKSLDSSLRPVALRNMESTAITTREMKPGENGQLSDSFRIGQYSMNLPPSAMNEGTQTH
jgi:hypothetical protein